MAKKSSTKSTTNDSSLGSISLDSRKAKTPSGVSQTTEDNSKFQNAITGSLETLVESMSLMKEEMTAIAGAVFGKSSMPASTTASQLLSSMSSVKLEKTPLGGLLKAINEQKFENAHWLNDLSEHMDAVVDVVENISKQIEAKSAGTGNQSLEQLHTLNGSFFKTFEYLLTDISKKQDSTIEAIKSLNVSSIDHTKQLAEITAAIKSSNGGQQVKRDNSKKPIRYSKKELTDIIDFLRTLDSLTISKSNVNLDDNLLVVEQNVETIINKINIISSKIPDFKDKQNNINNLKSFVDVVNGLASISNTLSDVKLTDVVLSNIKLESLTDLISELSKMSQSKELNAIANIEFSAENFDEINDIIYEIQDIQKRVMKTSLMTFFASFSLDEIMYFLRKLANQDDKDSLITCLMTIVKKVDAESQTVKTSFKDLNDILLSVKNLCDATVSAGKLSKATMKDVDSVNQFQDKIKTISDKMSSNDMIKSIEMSQISAKSIMKLVAIASGIILLGALTGAYVVSHIKEILIFGTTLIAFVGGLILALSIVSSGSTFKNSFEAADGIAKLVAVCATVMFAAALLGNYVLANIVPIAQFALILGAFIFAVTAVFIGAKSSLSASEGTAKDLAVLIAVSAGIMFIGAAFMLIPGILPLLTAFTKTLAIFIIGTIGVYAVAGAMSMGTIKFAKDVKNLIITSTAIMFLGAIVLMKYPQIVPWCLGFTVLFAAFITGVTLPFKLIKDDVKTSVKSALIFAGLVSLSAAILLIGAHAIDNNFGNALLFTGALSIFIFALMGTFYGVQKALDKNDPFATVQKLNLLILECVALMGLTALAVKLNGGVGNMLLNSSMLALSLIVWAGSAAIIGKFADNIDNGVYAAMKIAALVAVATLSVTLTNIAFAKYGIAQTIFNMGAMDLVIMSWITIAVVVGKVANEDISKGIKNLFGIAGLAAVASFIIVLTNKGIGNSLSDIAFTLAKVAIVDLLIGSWIWLAKKIGNESETINKGMKPLLVISGMALAAAGVIWITNNAFGGDWNKLGTTIAGLAVIDLVIMSWVWIAKKVGSKKNKEDIDNGIRAMAGLAIVGGMAAGVIWLTNAAAGKSNLLKTLGNVIVVDLVIASWIFMAKKVGSQKNISEIRNGIVAMAGLAAIGALAAGVIWLTNKVVGGTGFFKTLKNMVVLDLVVLSWIGIAKIVGSKNNIKEIGTGIVAMAGLAVIAAVAAGVIWLTNKVVGETGFFKTLGNMIILDLVILSWIGLAKIVGNKNNIKEIAMGVAALGMLTVVAALTAGVIWLTNKAIDGKVGETIVNMLVLVGTIVAMTFIAKHAGKHVKDIGLGILAMLGICVIVGLAGLAIAVATMAIDAVGGPGNAILAMLSIAAGVVIMGVIAGVAGIIPKNIIIQGELALAGIVGIIWLAGKAFQEVGKAVTENGGKLMLLANITTVAAAIAEMGALMVAAGALLLLPGVAPLLAAGALAFAGVSAVIWSVSEALIAMAAGVNAIKGLDFSGDEIAKNILEFRKVGDALANFVGGGENSSNFVGKIIGKGVWLAKVEAGTVAVMSMSTCVSKIADAVQHMASLTVPEYDKDGNVVSLRHLNDSDFDLAATNISKIITTIGGAIVDIVGSNPEMFESKWWESRNNTPFSRAVSACSELGNMIGLIAKGVSQVATMLVPDTDANGKANGKLRKMTEKDFTDAATNVAAVVSVLGASLIGGSYTINGKATKVQGVFNQHKDWFQSDSILSSKSSPFYKVVSGCKGMGSVISEIAKGIQDVANLKVPIYDKDGKETGFRNLTPIDFLMTGLNVSLIISCLGNALLRVADKHPDWFDDPSWFSNKPENTKFGRIVACCKGIGGIVSEMAKGIQDVANMNFTDADGKTQRIDILHDSETYKEIISKMMTSIAEGVAGGKVIGSWSLQKATDSVNGSLPIIEKAIEIYKKIIAATTGENAITVDNIEENCDKIKNVILSVNKMIVNKDMQDTLKNQSDETFKTITSFLDNSNKMISKFGESLKKIAEVMSKVSLDSVEQFKKTIDTYKEAMTALASATVAFNDSSASSITNFNSWGNVQDLDRFANSIKGISSALDSLTYDNLTKLNRETKDLSEFTQSINTLDTSKVNAFTNLSQSMADLSASLGGLDGLTDALANKLSAVLVKLTDELHDTKSTFNTAERLRESREKFVEKAIKRVEDVMKNPMKVKVGLEDENTATSGGSTGSGYSGGSSSYAGGGTPAPQITSPESNMGLASPIAPQETPTEDFTTSPFQNNQPAQSTTKTVDEKKPQSQVNLNNINSTIRETVSSVFEEMIQKYALDGNVAKGNARPSW